jgi:hypothetical protein
MDALLIFAPLLSLALLWPLSTLLRQDAQQTRRLVSIERKLQLVMDHLNIAEPQPALPEVVRQR